MKRESDINSKMTALAAQFGQQKISVSENLFPRDPRIADYRSQRDHPVIDPRTRYFAVSFEC